jgi:hypothetical protein
MGIGASLTTFSPGTTISSSAINANFSSLNSSGLSNDSGAISTSGGGVITATGFVTSSGDNVSISTSGKLQFGSNNVMYVETANGFLDLQMYGSGGKITFKDNSGNSVAAINPGTHSLQFVDNSSVYRDALYINTGAGEIYIQQIGSGKFIVKDVNGNNLFSVDSSGNLKSKGSLTQNTTP